MHAGETAAQAAAFFASAASRTTSIASSRHNYAVPRLPLWLAVRIVLLGRSFVCSESIAKNRISPNKKGARCYETFLIYSAYSFLLCACAVCATEEDMISTVTKLTDLLTDAAVVNAGRATIRVAKPN
jgi:hypothetical protein